MFQKVRQQLWLWLAASSHGRALVVSGKLDDWATVRKIQEAEDVWLRQGHYSAQLDDLQLLEEIANAAADFRSQIIRGDVDWVFEGRERHTKGAALSRLLCDLLVERIRRNQSRAA